MKKSFHCIDGHTCGNPVRLVTSGAPILQGANMMEKRLHFLREYDWIRKSLMFEPRGHDMMSGSFLYGPSDPDNDIGILFIETSGCLPMCGHGTIGTVTFMLQEGLVQPKIPGRLRLETPAGLIHVEYSETNSQVTSVKLTNIASFLYAENLAIESEFLGKLRIDVSYGGNFYAIIDVQENFAGLEYFSAEQLIQYSRELRDNLNKQYNFVHPENENISGLSHILWTGKTINKKNDGRNAVFYGDKAIDRSPCGTGTSARMAQLFAKGVLKKGDIYKHESFIGSVFQGKVEKLTRVGDFPAILPSIEGWAKVTGYNRIIIDEDDPYWQGFQVI